MNAGPSSATLGVSASAGPGPGDAVERERAERLYVEQRRAFQAHAGVFAAGMIVMFVVNLATNLAAGIAGNWSAWWSVRELIGWSLGVAVHGFVVWLNQPSPPFTA